jgi:hypothetical protein
MLQKRLILNLRSQFAQDIFHTAEEVKKLENGKMIRVDVSTGSQTTGKLEEYGNLRPGNQVTNGPATR